MAWPIYMCVCVRWTTNSLCQYLNSSCVATIAYCVRHNWCSCWYKIYITLMSQWARCRLSQITSLGIVYSTVYSGAHQRKHQSSASLVFVWGIHRGPVNSPHKRPVTRKMFPFDDVIMYAWNNTYHVCDKYIVLWCFISYQYKISICRAGLTFWDSLKF